MAIVYPAEGRNYLLDVAVNNGSKIGNWYVMLFEGNYTPQDSDTAANIVSRATEVTAYAEGTRLPLVIAAPANGKTSNAGNLARFTLNAPKTIYGFAIVSSAAKGGTTGKLLCLQKLATPRPYLAGDKVDVPITLELFNPA